MTEAINKDMTIGDLVQKFPSSVEVLLGEGVHCVGCGAAYYETIEQGLRGHGYSDEHITSVVKKLNDSIPKESGDKEELVITEKAASKLKEIIMQHNKEGWGLRVSVMTGGCSGFQYEMELVERADDGDKTIGINGVNFYIDSKSVTLLKGAKIDYLDSLQGAGFKISNPNAKETCGCGQSFS